MVKKDISYRIKVKKYHPGWRSQAWRAWRVILKDISSANIIMTLFARKWIIFHLGGKMPKQKQNEQKLNFNQNFSRRLFLCQSSFSLLFLFFTFKEFAKLHSLFFFGQAPFTIYTVACFFLSLEYFETSFLKLDRVPAQAQRPRPE